MKYLKICTAIAAAFSLCSAAYATDTVLNPVADCAFRTNGTVSSSQQDVPTGWNSGFPKASPETVECTYSSKMWGQQKYDVTDIDWSAVTSVTLTLYNQNSATYRLGAWLYPDADWTEETQQTWTEGSCPLVENFKTVVGAYPGHQTAGKTYTTYADESDANILKVKQVITFTGDALTKLKDAVVTSGERQYVNFIITFRETDASISSRKVVYYALNTTTEGKTPFLTITAADPAVTNLTTGTGYAGLAQAVAAASADDILQLNEDVTVSGSRIGSTVALTIQGKTGNEKILRDTKLDNMIMLPEAALTLKNLTIDGQGVNRSKCVIEASSAALTMENVTVQNFDRSTSGQTQGLITLKNKGSVILDGCTFKDNRVAEGYGDIFVGLTNALTLKGANTIGNGIYVEKAHYIIDGGTTHTAPITVIAASNRSTNNGLGSNKAFIKGTVDIHAYTLSSGVSSWGLAGNEDDNWIYVTKEASVTLSSDKTMQAGKGYRLGSVTVE